jgi:hypothetical protein
LKFPCGKLYFRGNKDVTKLSEHTVLPFDSKQWHDAMDSIFKDQKLIQEPPMNHLVKVNI